MPSAPDQRDRPTPRPTDDSSLGRISTNWDLLAQARDGAAPAQHALLLRYGDAVARYLRRSVGDPQAADDLCQEFAVRWLSGAFRAADPARGRFRAYLATALHNLVIDHYRRRRADPQPLQSGSIGHPPAPPDPDQLEAAFVAEWRQGVLDAAWRELERAEADGGGPYYTVLRWRASHPGAGLAECAAELTARGGSPVTPAGVRQTLHRAREKFARLLVDEVARSLGGGSPDEVERELADLGLLGYCRPARRTG